MRSRGFLALVLGSLSVLGAVALCGCGSVQAVHVAAPPASMGLRIVIAPFTDEGRSGLHAELPFGLEHGCMDATTAAGYRVVVVDPFRYAVVTPIEWAKDWEQDRRRVLDVASALGADSVVVGAFTSTRDHGVGRVRLQWLAVPDGRLLGETKLETVDGYGAMDAGDRACLALLTGAVP